MKVVLLANPASGKGRAEAQAGTIAAALGDDGVHVVRVRAERGNERALREALHEAGALVIVGGDGTLHHALSEIARSGVPVYHAGMGTENLFARQFGMSREVSGVRRALATRNVRPVDLGEANGRFFSLMVSVGPDAAVVHRLASTRRAGISHLSYVRPILSELRVPPPKLWVAVDGEVVIEGKRGMVVVANSAQYALRSNPASAADMSDGVLDIVFLPADSSFGSLLGLLRCRVSRVPDSAGRIHVRGARVRIEPDDEQAAAFSQIDGEAFDVLSRRPGSAEALDILIRPGAMSVLTT